jgi:hypothetical protein
VGAEKIGYGLDSVGFDSSGFSCDVGANFRFQVSRAVFPEKLAVLLSDFRFGFVARILPVKADVLETFISLFKQGVTLHQRSPREL